MKNKKFGYGVDEVLILVILFILSLSLLGLWKIYEDYGNTMFWVIVTAPISFVIVYTIFDWIYSYYTSIVKNL